MAECSGADAGGIGEKRNLTTLERYHGLFLKHPNKSYHEDTKNTKANKTDDFAYSLFAFAELRDFVVKNGANEHPCVN